MSKYIDLLREHEQKKAETASVSRPEGTIHEVSLEPKDDTHPNENPYSNRLSTNPADVTTSHELLEEDELTPPATKEAVHHHNLLLEEDDTDTFHTETTTKTTKEVKKSLGQAVSFTDAEQSFNISAWLQHLSQELLKVFQSAQQGKPTDISSINEHLQAILVQLEGKKHTLDALELEMSRNIKKICDAEISLNDLVQKSIMMMLYTIKISIHLKLEQQETIHQTTAAMLHHIGMAMVPNEVRQKIGKLTKDEIKMIKQAPQKAVDYLKSCHIENESVMLAASQSGERYDGSGTTGLSGHSIAWVARIVGLLSMFEALIHIRPYRPRLLPRDAIRELVNRHKKAFDPVLLKALIESNSLYPVGTFIQLNTGEVGQVITIHQKFPLRPVVHINMDRHGNLITERQINLKEQPNLMIQKCMYEEALKSLGKKSIQV